VTETEALACCIERARRLARGDESSTSEVYWHTREAVMGIALSRGIRVQEVLSSLMEVRFPTDDPRGVLCRSPGGGAVKIPRSLVNGSGPFWTDVVHPDVLVLEVMES